MAVVSMKQLLEAGVHFGHQTRRWNPKMAKYIFTERNGIYIIDLQKTVKKLDEAYSFVRDTATAGGSILFVGTKKQAQDSVREEATRCGMHYVNARWLGGMLTNFRTIRRRIDRMEQINKMREDGTFDMLPKKEVAKLELELEKLEKFLGGVKTMIDDNRYCGDVLVQLAAAESAVRSISSKLLQNHLETCVVEQIQRGNVEVVDEVMQLMRKFSR